NNNVIISTIDGTTMGNGDINVNSAVSWPMGAATTLNLFANQDINVNANITALGTGNISMIASRDVKVINAIVSSDAGSISILANRSLAVGSAAATVTSRILSTSGPIDITTTAYYDNTSSIDLLGGAAMTATAFIQSTSGSITLNSAGTMNLIG